MSVLKQIDSSQTVSFIPHYTCTNKPITILLIYIHYFLLQENQHTVSQRRQASLSLLMIHSRNNLERQRDFNTQKLIFSTSCSCISATAKLSMEMTFPVCRTSPKQRFSKQTVLALVWAGVGKGIFLIIVVPGSLPSQIPARFRHTVTEFPHVKQKEFMSSFVLFAALLSCITYSLVLLKRLVLLQQQNRQATNQVLKRV